MASFDMVFEGGGAKGSMFAGALEVFYAAGHKPARLVGTSAGAITAVFVAVGYKPDEMLAIVNERKNGTPVFASFMDVPVADAFDDDLRANCQLTSMLKMVSLRAIPDSFENRIKNELIGALLNVSPHFRQIFGLVECGGLFAGDAFCQWLTEKLKFRNVSPGCTLGDLFKQTQRDLSLVATDTTNREMLVLNHRTAPGVPVVSAVRMSMSIPFVWSEVEWKKEWGPYIGRDKAGARIVDGGVLSNFAIDLLATDNQRARKYMGENTDPTQSLNVGLLIDEAMPVAGVDPIPKRTSKLATVRRIQRLVDTMTGARDNALIREYQDQICRLPAMGYGTTEFDMTPEKLGALVESGRTAMRQHLASRGLGAQQDQSAAV